MRSTARSTIAALLLALVGEARAEEPSPEMLLQHLPRVRLAVKLEFTTGRGAELCPSSKAVAGRTLLRMQYDPFEESLVAYHAGVLRIHVTGSANGLTGTYAYVDESGKTLASDSVTERGTDELACYWLIDMLAVGIAADLLMREMDLATKLERTARPKVEPACDAVLPCPESPFAVWPREWPLPPLRAPVPDPPKPAEKAPFALRFGASVWPELVAAGWGSLGFSAEVGARYRFVSLGAEVHGDPPLGSATYPNVGAVSFARLSGALLLCGHFGWFAGCAVGDAGRFLFPAPVRDLPASSFYGALGARVGLEFPIVPSRFFLRTALDLRAPLAHTKYIAGPWTIFEAAGPGAGLGLGLLVELPR
jgi:hypothetical protein